MKLRAIRLEDLPKRKPNSICIMNNLWIYEVRRLIVPIHPMFRPWTSIEEDALELIEFFGDNFFYQRLMLAYLPRDLISGR